MAAVAIVVVVTIPTELPGDAAPQRTGSALALLVLVASGAEFAVLTAGDPGVAVEVGSAVIVAVALLAAFAGAAKPETVRFEVADALPRGAVGCRGAERVGSARSATAWATEPASAIRSVEAIGAIRAVSTVAPSVCRFAKTMTAAAIRLCGARAA
jgi:hypothetical protein